MFLTSQVGLRLTTDSSENFQNYLSHMIKASNTFQTVIPKGKIPFVSTEDIGQAAYEAIVNPSTLSSNEVFLIGPDLLSYDEVRASLCSLLVKDASLTTISHPSSGC